jgi:phosphoribosylaminoimidazole carboxylase (NCAIR synthetase)
MPIVFFVAPYLSPSAARMVTAAASLPGVRLGVVTQDPQENAPPEVRAAIAQHWRVDDVTDLGQLAGAVEALTQRLGRPDRLFGAYEQLQVPLAQLREHLGLPGLPVQAAVNFRDKARMKDVLRAAGVPVARHALVTSADTARAFVEEVGFPVVVKPPAGAGSVATFRVERLDQLDRAVAAAAPDAGHPALVEEFVVGDEYSLETMSVDGRAVWHSLTRYYPTPLEVTRQPWIQWCVVLPREVDDPRFDDIRRVGAQALGALGMTTGLTHMEWFRRGDGTLAVSEVAARPPGAQITTLVSRSTDSDFVRAWAELMVLGTFTPPVRRYAAGVAFLRAQGKPGGVIRAVHGVDRLSAATRELVTDAQMPFLGAGPRPSYEGDGWMIVRHPETAAVERALSEIISTVRVELA